MNFFKNLIDSVDSRILHLDFSKLVNFTYLTEPSPKTFGFSGWLILLLFVNTIIISVLYILLKKRYIPLAGKRRVILKRILKTNVLIIVVWMAFIFFRFQSFAYLSMRLWQVLMLLIYVLFNLVGMIRLLRTKSVSSQSESIDKNVSYYQDYLPKKNKRRKK